MPVITGELTPAEREIIKERDRLTAQYKVERNPQRRRYLLDEIKRLMGRMRRGRWERGEVK